jgi:hypothetical protein
MREVEVTRVLRARHETALRGLGLDVPGALRPRRPLPKEPLIQPPGESHRILVKFQDELLARARPDGSVEMSLAVADADLEAVVAEHGLRFERGQVAADEDLARLEARGWVTSGEAPADLAGMLAAVPARADRDAVWAAARDLHALAAVEFAEVSSLDAPPPPPGPVDIAPPSELLTSFQTYRTATGISVDAVWASYQTKGRGVMITDCEYWYNPDHEDMRSLVMPQANVQSYFTGWGADHGTAVLGMLTAAENEYGMTGMTTESVVRFYPESATLAGGTHQSRTACVTAAISSSAPGDIVLLEMQTTGAGGGFGPAELTASVWTAVHAGTHAGVVVVAAAGNGNQNLDDEAYAPYRARGDSGAIIVGAGNSSRAKLSFSTHGARVNVQGWGSGVATLGYGALRKYGNDDNQAYTAGFSGTSSASPIVTAAAALMQSRALEIFDMPLTPAMIRQILMETGLPQTGSVAQQIGPLPSLPAIFALLDQMDGARAEQTVEFSPVADQTGLEPVPLVATGGASGNPVLFEVVSGPARVEGALLTPTGPGEVVVRARQPGNMSFKPAEAEQMFRVGMSMAEVTFSNLQQDYTGDPLEVGVITNPPGLPVTVLYNGSPEKPTEAGPYEVQAVTLPPWQGGATGVFVIRRPDISILPGPGVSMSAASELRLHLGVAAPGGVLLRQLYVKNTGTGVLTQLRAEITGDPGIRIHSPPVDSLAPGEESEMWIEVVAANFGLVAADLHVTSGNPGSELVARVEAVSDARGMGGIDPARPPDFSAVPATVWSWGNTGVYSGLLWSEGEPDKPVGCVDGFRLSWSARDGDMRSFSGRVRMGGRMVSVRGKVSADGVCAGRRTLGGGVELEWRLQLALEQASGDSWLVGFVRLDDEVFDARLVRAAFRNGREPLPWHLRGVFNALLPGQAGWGGDEPGGDGWLRLLGRVKGRVSAAGRMADGSVLVAAGHLSGAGRLFLFRDRSHHRPGGWLFGADVELSEGEPGGHPQARGLARFARAAREGARRYSGGFDLTALTVIGGRVAKPRGTGWLVAQGFGAFSATEPEMIEGVLALSKTGLGSMDHGQLVGVTLDNPARGGVIGLRGGLAAGRVYRSNGVFDGWWRGEFGRVRLRGMLIPGHGLIGGQFLTGNGSGAIRVAPVATD